MRSLILLIGGMVFMAGCQELPANIMGYEACVKMNAEPLLPRDHDPHFGTKNVYACGVTVEDLYADGELQIPLVNPYPLGTIIVKESYRDDQDYPWLIATAQKSENGWTWYEYKRNFENEAFVRLPIAQSVCSNCHADAAGTDMIFQLYEPTGSE
ncbi:MAG: hypothetical protein CMH54_00790 [Myxococcales bacterium]|nr:hypothetical protein [Myxococcales bacterium]